MSEWSSTLYPTASFCMLYKVKIPCRITESYLAMATSIHLPLYMLVCRVCGNLALRNVKPRTTGDASRRISNQVGSLILLKETLELLPGLGQPLEGSERELLHAIGGNCCHEVFQSLLESVTQVLDEVRPDTTAASRLSILCLRHATMHASSGLLQCGVLQEINMVCVKCVEVAIIVLGRLVCFVLSLA